MDSIPPLVLPRSAPDSVGMMVAIDVIGRADLESIGLSHGADPATFAAVREALAGWRFAPAEQVGCVVPSYYERVFRR
jgi:hypothetical protein